jgi:adenylate kinase
LSAHYDIAHISSGDLLRRDAAVGTDVGRLAADYLLRGDLVPDEVVIEILAVPVLEAARHGGYVLDGFPRTLRQAEEAYQVARRIEGVELQAVIHLEVGRGEIRRRLVARGLRDGRSDDNEVAIAHRLDVFASETEPMLGFYAARGLVLDINGEQQVGRVFDEIVTAVDRATADQR